MNWGPVPFLIENGDPDIVGEVQNRYNALRKTVWSDENIMSMLDSYEEDIYGSGPMSAPWSAGQMGNITMMI